MLSIIISSYQPQFYSALEKNIAETIGIPYEIIKIDNPNLMGICEAYNKGASLSKYDYLLFIHEDVLFHTKGWGVKLISHLSLENVGVVGVAGSNYVPKAPSTWFLLDNSYHRNNFIQSNREGTLREIKRISKIREKVFSLDGVFLAVKKNVFDEFLFDEEIIGYHGYDLVFSLSVAKKYNNYVLGDILVEHFSVGKPDITLFDNNIKVRKKIKYNFHDYFDEHLECITFLTFLQNYFTYYKPTLKKILLTLQFLPKKNSFEKKKIIILDYLHYLRKI